MTIGTPGEMAESAAAASAAASRAPPAHQRARIRRSIDAAGRNSINSIAQYR
jgi:hypothetical protein